MIEEIFVEKRNYMKKKYNRVLPTNELLFDRWEKAKYLNAGERSSIYDSSIIMGEVKIGKDVWIGPFTLLEGINGKIVIEDFVSISTGVQILCHDATKDILNGTKDIYTKKGDIFIGHNTIVGGGKYNNAKCKYRKSLCNWCR